MLPLPVHSAGTLLHRIRLQQPEILLGHPSGDSYRRAPWSIPKGLPNKDACLEPAVRRGKRGVGSGQLEPLGFIRDRRYRKLPECG